MIQFEIFTAADIPDFLSWFKNADARFLLQFAGSGYSYPLTADQINENIISNNHLLFKALEESDRIIGHCQLTKIDMDTESASIGRVLIHSDFRGNGYGSLMLEDLIQYAKGVIGLKTLSLRVFDFNIPAFSCYQKLGFVESKREEKYFDVIDETWTCITMDKILG